MKIYVANLSAYNEGYLVGNWIDLPTTTDDLQAQINTILGTDEEYAIHDYEAPFPVYEYSNPYHLNQIAELDEYDLEKFAFLVDQGYDWVYALDNFNDVTCYPDANLTTVAEELLNDGCFGEISESVMPLIDVDRVVDMLDIDGYQETDKGVFFYQ